MTTKSPSNPNIYNERKWGSFEYIDDKNEKKSIHFTKQDNKRGGLGYVFGRNPDCDVILTSGERVSGHHFLIYREIEHAAECVYLRDLSSHGTIVNDVLVETGRTVRLQHGDKITYVAYIHRDTPFYGHLYTFCEGDQGQHLTFGSQFEIGKVLGSGNFASVYQTTEKKSKKVYAVKVVKKSGNFNLKFAQSLEREIGTLMCIDHPNLLQIHKVFNEESHHYLVTELGKGGELFDRVKEKQKFTEAESRIVFRQLLSGVKYLHSRGIVHRDLKLENVLLMDSDSLTVKISDFGLANIIGEQKFLSTICGTPSYVAPEVIRNQEYGKAVDMWSLGVILYIFLCGFPPFSDDLAPPKLRIQVLECCYTFPSPYWDRVTDEAVDLVQGLLLSNPKLRLTVDAALDHPWMHLKDNQGTLPEHARTEIAPKVNALVAKLTSFYNDRRRERSRSKSHQSLISLPSQHSDHLQQQRIHRSQSMSSIDEASKCRGSSLSASPVPPGDESDNDFNFFGGEGCNSNISPSPILPQTQTQTQDSGSQLWSPVGSFIAPEPMDNDILKTDTRAKKKRRV